MVTGQGGRVLIVEDDPGVATLQQRRLQRMGYETLLASTAEEALQKCLDAGVELAVLDYRLPGNITGLEIFEHLKAQGRNLPVIIVTGFSDESMVVKALRAGVRDFVTKTPEYLDYLPEAVQRVLKTVRTEKQLADSEARLREQAALLDKANDAIMVRGPDDTVQYWNKSAERLYGWTAEEVMGKNATALLYDRVSPDLQRAIQTVVEKGEWVGELQQINKQRKIVVVASRWTLVRNAAGEPANKLIINTDITEKKQLEAQFLRAQRMESLGTIAGGIAHDLNNVLTPILMAAQLLQTPLPEARRQSMLESMRANAERGADMVKQVLSFARGVEGQRIPIQLRSVIKEFTKMLQPTISKAIDVRCNVGGDLWPISGDATQVYQVLMNLCLNARDAMPSGGKLQISAENVTLAPGDAHMDLAAKPGPYVLLRVTDSGTGISADAIDKIFDPFFTTKELGKGTGLGLSTVMGIVRSHGAYIKVASEVGTGSTFSVFFPAIPANKPAPDSAGGPQLPRGNGELILVVDDERAIRDVVRDTLESYGYRVLTASNGNEAVSLFLKNRADVKLVLTDLMMPIMDGTSAIGALRALEPELPVIAASGLAVNGKPPAAAAAFPGLAFLPKPYTPDSLLKMLQQKLAAG